VEGLARGFLISQAREARVLHSFVSGSAAAFGAVQRMLSNGHLRWQVLQCRQFEGLAKGHLTFSRPWTILRSIDRGRR